MKTALNVRCPCGATGGTRGGTSWRCPGCGTHWSTSTADQEEYQRFHASIRRLKSQAAGGAVVILAVSGVLFLIVGPAVLLSVPLALGVFYIAFLPSYRRRLRALYAELPQWRLTRVE